MPEYMELVILRLALLMLIVAGVSVITSINTNVRHKVLSADAVDRTQPGDVMEPNTNPSGTEQDPDGFLGETGALVMDVQHTGNSLAMLLKSPKDGPDEPQSYRVLTWTFRQGCALGWFPGGRAEDKCKPNTYPASYFQRFRSRMSYWFCFTNLLGGGKEVLAQIDCTTKMNAAEWNMNTVPPDFEFSPGWFDRISGNVSILEQPSVWMARVREDFERRVVLEPDLPAVLWMGDKATSPIWKGIGYKSKSEILNRFWKCTKIGVFVTLGELAEMGPEGVDRLTDLCLCTIMFLQSEVWAGKYYDLKVHDISHNVKLWRHTYLVFGRKGMVKCGPMRTDEHDQIWADNDSIPPHQWERMANLAKAPWKKAPEATKDKGTPWCTETTAGSINYSIRYDYPYFEKHPEEDLPESFCFLAPFSNKTVDSNCMDVAKQAPSMAKRARVEQASKDCVVEKKRQRLESEIEPQGKKKKRKAKPGPLDRREAWYGKAGWREYAGKLVTGLDAHGLKFTLLKDLEQAFENMVKVH